MEWYGTVDMFCIFFVSFALESLIALLSSTRDDHFKLLLAYIFLFVCTAVVGGVRPGIVGVVVFSLIHDFLCSDTHPGLYPLCACIVCSRASLGHYMRRQRQESAMLCPIGPRETTPGLKRGYGTRRGEGEGKLQQSR